MLRVPNKGLLACPIPLTPLWVGGKASRPQAAAIYVIVAGASARQRRVLTRFNPALKVTLLVQSVRGFQSLLNGLCVVAPHPTTAVPENASDTRPFYSAIYLSAASPTHECISEQPRIVPLAQ